MRRFLTGFTRLTQSALSHMWRGGGAHIGLCGEVDEDGDVVQPGGGKGGGIPGLEGWVDEGIGEG